MVDGPLKERLHGGAVDLPRIPRGSIHGLGQDSHRGREVIPMKHEDRVRVARHGFHDIDPLS